MPITSAMAGHSDSAGGGGGGASVSFGGGVAAVSKPHRSVVIDDEDIDAYSPDYEDGNTSYRIFKGGMQDKID